MEDYDPHRYDEVHWRMNEDQTKMVTDGALFGYPCYEGSVIDGYFEGKRVTSKRTPAEAEIWLWE